jgi:hypothetical protein
VSKRTRGSTRTQHHRPGTRPATARSTSSRERPLRSSTVESTSQLEAAPAIAEDLVEDRPEEARAELERVARATGPRHRVKAGSLLAARAATEYVYVSQDMRRILFVSAILFGTLIVLWLLIVVMRVLPLSFY